MSALSRFYSVPRARLGWLFLFVGVFAWFIFGRNADWKSINFYRSQLQQTNGFVTSTSTTGFTSGDGMDGSNVYEVRFTFDGPDNRKIAGTSWTDDTPPKRGAKIQVEYTTSIPVTARIVNMRSGVLPLWTGAVLVFPIFGVYCIVRAILVGYEPHDQ